MSHMNGIAPDKPVAAERFIEVNCGTPEQPEMRRIRLFTPADARKPRPPRVDLVQDLITPASLTILTGDPGSGKTWLACDMAVCVAMGKDWIGRKVKQGTVLIIDEESGKDRLHERMQWVLDAHEAADDAPIFYTCLNSLALAGADATNSAFIISELIRQTGATFVVIDALTDIAIGLDENSAAEMALLLHPLRDIMSATKAAIVLLHHKNKSGGMRGSTNIPALADLAMSLTAPDGKLQPVRDVVSDKARDVAEFKFSFDLNIDKPAGHAWLSPRKAVDVPKFNPNETYVMRWLEENGEGKISDMVNEDKGMSKSKLRKAVDDLKDGGHVVRVDSGATTTAGIYALASDVTGRAGRAGQAGE